jgi:hypothetical protein
MVLYFIWATAPVKLALRSGAELVCEWHGPVNSEVGF